MNLSAIFSKTGKGVQEASGKTSHLSRADRAVLSAIDGKTALAEVQKHFEKIAGPKFEALIQQLDKDGYIREVSSGSQPAAPARPAAPAAKAPPKPAAPVDDGSDGLDFTQAIKIPPKAPAPAAPKPPPVDLAAVGRADAERKAKEQAALDFRTRQDAEAKAKAEAEQKAKAAAEARARAEAESKARAAAEAKAREAAEAKARADAEAKARNEAEAKARADADAKTRAEAEAKVKAAREAAVRMATEAKAKAEAEARAKAEEAERDKARLEAELNAKLEAERKAREEAEKRAAEAAERTRKEVEEKAKRDAEEMRQRLEAEMKAKLEAERKAREEEDRKRREEEDRRRKEEDERRAKEEAERRAREEADRKRREEEDRKRREEDERRRKEDEERRAREEADRKRREEEDRKRREEDERRRKEDDERRAKEEAERKALEDTNRRLETDRKLREEADRKAKEEADRRAKEDAERRAREDAERKAKEDADRRAREDADRRAKEEAEAKARAAAQAAADAAASLPKVEAVAPPPPPPAPAAPAAGALGDLLGDLDSFGKREEEEQKEREEAERKAKEAAERKAKEDAERRAKEEAEAKRREEEKRRREEEEARRAKEEEERKAQEEEDRRKEEEAERKRKAKEAAAAKEAEERAARKAAARPAAGKGASSSDDDDIGVTDEDLEATDDLKRDQKVVADRARKAAREAPPVAVATGRPKKWGKPAAIVLFVLLLAGIGVLNVMPLSTAEYEKAASDALGVPVKIGSARLATLTGVEVKMEGVTVGGAKIRLVRGSPEMGSLFGARKAFSRVELEGLQLSQSQLGDALAGKAAGENLRIGRVVVKQLTLEGPLKIPALDVEATVAGDGTLQSVRATGPDKLVITLTPKGSEFGFDLSAGSLAIPFVPALSLSEFSMKGTATRSGVTTSEFDGRAYDGIVGGSARIRWGDSWSVEGEIKPRNLKVAVFAPTLVSEGRVEGRGAFSMSGSTPGALFEGARLQGEFKIDKGVLGSFDLSRALQTGGNQFAGRTIFNELTGQGIYDKGSVQLTNVSIQAGAMNAGASLNIDTGGNLAGRIVADLKTASQTQRATLNIAGKLQDPQVRK